MKTIYTLFASILIGLTTQVRPSEPPTGCWQNCDTLRIPINLAQTTLPQGVIDTVTQIIDQHKKKFVSQETIYAIMNTEQEECSDIRHLAMLKKNYDLYPLTRSFIELRVLQLIFQAQRYGYAGNRPLNKIKELYMLKESYILLPEHVLDLNTKIIMSLETFNPTPKEDTYDKFIKFLFRRYMASFAPHGKI